METTVILCVACRYSSEKKSLLTPKYTNKCAWYILWHNALHRTELGTVLFWKLLGFPKFIHDFEERRERLSYKSKFLPSLRTRVLNRDLEHLFPLLWIRALTTPMSFTFWVYLDSCPEAPNWAQVTGNSCGIPSAFCFQWLLCCNRLAVRQIASLEKASQPLICHHIQLPYQMCVWVLRGFHIWSVRFIFKHDL